MSDRPVGAITLFVDDIARAREFYARAFAAEPVWEDDVSAVFACSNTLINLLEQTRAPELIAPHAVAERGAGSSMMLSIWVDDTDAAVAEIAARGVELLNGPVDRPWGKRTAAFADPDGHVWELAQNI